MLQLHAEQPAGELFQNRAGYFYAVFLAHKPLKIEIEEQVARGTMRSSPPTAGAPCRNLRINPQSRWRPGDLSARGSLQTPPWRLLPGCDNPGSGWPRNAR